MIVRGSGRSERTISGGCHWTIETTYGYATVSTDDRNDDLCGIGVGDFANKGGCSDYVESGNTEQAEAE